MVRSVGQIEQELASLEQSVERLSSEFLDCYEKYLTILGQVVRQQFIVASHHICTQAYPEAFLQLSFQQRQQLQQALSTLAKEAQVQLLRLLQPPARSAQQAKTEIQAEFPTLSDSLVLSEANSARLHQSPSAFPIPELELSILEPQSGQQPEPEPLPPESQEMALETPLTPDQLEHWREQLERAILIFLRSLSWEANRLLQQAEILPPKLPEPFLELALKSEVMNEAVTGPPNILDITLEAIKEGSGSSQKGSEEGLLPNLPLRLVAMHLSLSELEFSNPTITSWRTQLRQLTGQLHKLGQTYQKKQKERAIAAAEEAWRSSWFEG